MDDATASATLPLNALIYYVYAISGRKRGAREGGQGEREEKIPRT